VISHRDTAPLRSATSGGERSALRRSRTGSGYTSADGAAFSPVGARMAQPGETRRDMWLRMASDQPLRLMTVAESANVDLPIRPDLPPLVVEDSDGRFVQVRLR
jgi:hypothetical protein